MVKAGKAWIEPKDTKRANDMAGGDVFSSGRSSGASCTIAERRSCGI